MINFYLNPLFDFELEISKFTGAPYTVVTDCCTHALELCFIYDEIKQCEFTAYTYIGIPMLMRKLNIKYQMTNDKWEGEFKFLGTRIYDSARRFEKNMYKPGSFQCLSFGSTKPLEIGRIGAILTDDYQAYKTLSLMRSDGRDLKDQSWQRSEQLLNMDNQGSLSWGNQTQFNVGYHYCPTVIDCKKGLELLKTYQSKKQAINYTDCRKIIIL